jgi:hypothetical protein
MRAALFMSLALGVCFAVAEDFAWAPTKPGRAVAPKSQAEVWLENDAMKFGVIDGTIKVQNKWTGAVQELGIRAVRLTLKGGKVLTIPFGSRKVVQRLLVNRVATRQVERRAGVAIVVPFRDQATKLAGYWRLLLRDDSNYGRIEIGLLPEGNAVNVAQVEAIRFKSEDARVFGKTPGSPVVSGDFFFGLEHPMSESKVENGTVTCSMKRLLPLRPRKTVVYSAVIGVSSKGQTRRAFCAYVESERARPYWPFLHYNSWYDIGYFTPYSAADCLDRIAKFGSELSDKRGVKLDSFLFDDGWDDYNSVWKFHSGFPEGFLPLKEAALKYQAGPGVWLSPWGGYGDPRKKRLAFGKSVGMEVDSQGYALSGPKYYKRFHDVTMDFVTRQGINHFKLDGTGSPDKSTPGSLFDSDFDAAISLIADLRTASPGVFINLTTGTWPSPFWLKHADSIWRGGSDHSFAGVGTDRQQWMTYRDSDTYHGVVERGPLYPLNSLMLHGIIYAKHANKLNTDPGNDFRDDVRTYFGSGTQLQEMYISPELLTPQNWDDLAEAAKWARVNGEVLRDTHWVGGDPAKLEIYGWASWSAKKSILVLRNPSNKQQAFSVDVAAILELPAGFAKAYAGTSPWKSDAGQPPTKFPVGGSVVVDLKPFEVRTLDLTAVSQQ